MSPITVCSNVTVHACIVTVSSRIITFLLFFSSLVPLFHFWPYIRMAQESGKTAAYSKANGSMYPLPSWMSLAGVRTRLDRFCFGCFAFSSLEGGGNPEASRCRTPVSYYHQYRTNRHRIWCDLLPSTWTAKPSLTPIKQTKRSFRENSFLLKSHLSDPVSWEIQFSQWEWTRQNGAFAVT